MTIPFNKPYLTGSEIKDIVKAAELGQLSGDGYYTRQCTKLLKSIYQNSSVLLTHSCTAALEMCAFLLNIMPGDEIIMPSYTFVSTANAFVIRGGTPVFVDIDKNTLCIDLDLVEAAISPNTKAIVCVHYAGISCDMDRLKQISEDYDLPIIEDAAQAFGSTYKGQPLGSFGDLATISFHETKNIISGEGGCLIINNREFDQRAEIIREKGTNRSQFNRQEVNKYTWMDLGSSYLPGELISAFLYSQICERESIQDGRMLAWQKYHTLLSHLNLDFISLPYVPPENSHNAHMYQIICKNNNIRTNLIAYLRKYDVHSVFHYIPLQSSPAGKKYARTYGVMNVTEKIADTILRLPIYPFIDLNDIDYVCNLIGEFSTNEDYLTASE